jgi:V/A-type H+-transporting ATPase subunit K
MDITTFGGLFATILTGNNLAILGAVLAVSLAGMGSSKGVGIVGEASSGLLSEDPSKFGRALVLTVLPATQGIYGLVAALFIFIKLGIFGTVVTLTVAQGAYFLFAALPIAIVGFYSGIKQGRVAASGISLISKRPDEVGKAITQAALVETYAIFALLVTLLLVLMYQI